MYWAGAPFKRGSLDFTLARVHEQACRLQEDKIYGSLFVVWPNKKIQMHVRTPVFVSFVYTSIYN